MSAHRTIVEAGPGTIRRLCCAASAPGDDEIITTALDAIDDQMALAGGQPVAVDSLWRAALRSVKCGSPDERDPMVLVHPSWWPSSRVRTVTAAAATVAGDVLTRPRTWLLRKASDAEPEGAVVVEIAERLVVITGGEVVALPRTTGQRPVAEEAATVIIRMTREVSSVVLIDAPATVAGASTLAASIAGALRASGQAVMEVGEARLVRLARSALPAGEEPPRTERRDKGRSRGRTVGGLAAAAVVVAAAVPALATVDRRDAPPPHHVETVPTTLLVEGRVALTVPVNWPTQRVVGGPGSARVLLTSPSDADMALHITQSPVAGETLGGAAERLRSAIGTQPAGIFVDFNPAGISAGRPAVTYREVRAAHQVRWTVFVDGPVRISIGCQSRPGDENAVRDVCEQAVRSAHAIG
jgi:type VII secretion-associated protein (TIGR03931 family)